MKEFWNNRYAASESVYGTGPNAYFKNFIDHHQPGHILLPADGESRNGIYAASKSWQVDAFDFSEEARKKALARAALQEVTIHYELKDIADFRSEKKYDAVALIYIHLPAPLRKPFHREIYQSIKPGGYLVFEAYSKEQLQFDSGGPKEEELLYDAPTICQDFPFLHLLQCEQKEVELDEGPFHQGRAAVLRLTGQRL